MAKPIMYPLESCIQFHKKGESDVMWFKLLTLDPAYLHAAVFGIQTYGLVVTGQENSRRAEKAMMHYNAALRLLRERLSYTESGYSIENSTIFVVLYLALYAHFMDNYHIAQFHMMALRKIVDLRGGIFKFADSPKIILELIK